MNAAAGILMFALVAGTPGCVWAPHLAAVRNDILHQIPGASCDTKIELTLGPVSLAFARLVTAVVPDVRHAGRYLSDVSRVELGVYDLERVPTEQVSMPHELRRLQESDEWEMAVRARDDGELVWVFYRAERDRINEVYVIVIDDQELVMVRAQGRLERLVGYALSEYGQIETSCRAGRRRTL